MTLEHAQLQRLVLDGAARAGWQAEAEVPGEGWRADVLATHPQRSSIQVAIEVQWSAQTLHEYRRRQTRYADSDVRAAWLCRRQPATPREVGDLPAFILSQVDDVFHIAIGVPTLPVDVAVEQLLRGRWRHSETMRAQVRSDVATMVHRCWSCKRGLLLWCVTAAETVTAHGDDETWWRHPRFGLGVFERGRREAVPAIVAAVRQASTSSRLPVASMRRERTRASGESYDAFCCPSCSILQGETFLEEPFRTLAAGARVHSRVEVEHTASLALPHWCDGGCTARTS